MFKLSDQGDYFRIYERDLNRMQSIRVSTGLNDMSMALLIDHFNVEPNGHTRATFEQCIRELPKVEKMSEEAKARLLPMLGTLFDFFDLDSNNIIDFGELASGLAILCGGSKIQKRRTKESKPHTYTHTYTYTHTHTHTYTHTYTHIYTYTYIHTYLDFLPSTPPVLVSRM